jgi:hypothetical protein
MDNIDNIDLDTNLYNGKTITENYLFNTRFRNNYLNSIPQQCDFQLPNPITNVVKIRLLSIQIPNVMLAFSSIKFTTQIYIKEDTTNYAAIIVIPEGNYDETTFPVILTKCINEQLINPFILPVNYRFFVTIDPNTFFVTIKNTFYTFTMETITKYPSLLGNCALDYNLSSTNLTIYQTYQSTVTFVNSSTNQDNITLDYNTKNTVSDLLLKECVFRVKKIYYDASYTNLNLIYFTLNSIITGSLVLNYDLNTILDILFDSNNTDVLYVPLELTKRNNGITDQPSVDFSPLGLYGQYFYRHSCVMTANLLNSQLVPISKYTNANGMNNTTRNHIYTLKIYRNKKFELIQSNWGIMRPSFGFYSDFTVYTDMEEWKDHNTYDESIGYNPFSFSSSYYASSFQPPTPSPPNTTIPAGYTKEYGLFQMITNRIFIKHNSVQNYILTIQITNTHYPYNIFSTFPTSISATPTSQSLTPIAPTDPQLICKSKIGNLSEDYNYNFNDLDIKGKISEISISNTLGYQIGYRLSVYSGLKSYTSESSFDKTYLDYVYFSVDDYNNSCLNHNYGVLPNESILDKNNLAVVPIRSPQFSTTFDNGSDFIPKLRYYFTPVDVKRIRVKLLDPLGNLANINTNDYSFVLEFTKLMDITKK